MELQEFISAVENLLGVKCVEENELNLSISTDRLHVGINKKFLGEPEVWISHPGSEVIQPVGLDLAESFRRVQQASERADADWPMYEECAANALKEFLKYAKMPMDVVKGVLDQLPGYSLRPKGIDVQLFWITCDPFGEAMNGCSSVRRHMSLKAEDPGLYPVECIEVDNKLRIRMGGGRRDLILGIVMNENVEVSIRKFEILPEILSHSTTSDRMELPDNEGYERLTRRHEYTFLEFEVK